MSRQPFKRYVPDERIQKAPELPTDRPATRREVWERNHAIYFDFKSHRRTPICTERCDHDRPGELEAFCREAWVWYYVDAYNHRDWRKQPDWTEGDPVIAEAVPDEMFYSGEKAKWTRTIQALLETSHRLLPERKEQQLGMEAAA